MRKQGPQIVEQYRKTNEELARRALHVPGWNVGGADPYADLKAMGADRYYFANRRDYGVSVTILTDRPLEDFTPKGWRLIGRDGAPSVGPGEPWINFIHLLSARYVLASSGRSIRVGDVACSGAKGELRLFEIPGARLSSDEPKRKWMIAMFGSMRSMMEAEDDGCTRYDGDRVRGYTSRNFLLDGREPSPSSNPTHKIIVPACPIDKILKPPIKITKKMLRTPGFVFPPWSEAPRPRNC
ncbi:MAG TPA: hypothetical protein VIT45_03420 [Allosphingosinicella sp.]